MSPSRALAGAAGKLPPTNRHCFGCGQGNPHGLRLHFEAAALGSISSPWVPEAHCQSYEGIIHGGIIGTVLDEAMAKAASLAGQPAYTCELRMRLHRHVLPGERLTVTARTVERRRRLCRTEAQLTDELGCVRARAWGRFLTSG